MDGWLTVPSDSEWLFWINGDFFLKEFELFFNEFFDLLDAILSNTEKEYPLLWYRFSIEQDWNNHVINPSITAIDLNPIL